MLTFGIAQTGIQLADAKTSAPSDGALVPALSCSSHPARPSDKRTRKRERVRCSALVNWPVYPRLAHTMRASNGAQSWPTQTAPSVRAGNGGKLRRLNGAEPALRSVGDGKCRNSGGFRSAAIL